MEELNIEFNIHYIFYDETCKQMDAKVHNECERQLLLAIDYLKLYCDEDIYINVKSVKDGSIIDVLAISILCLKGSSILKTFFEALVDYLFNKKKNKLDDINNRLDILEKIKKQKLTKEEAIAIIKGDSRLKKCINAYYKSAKKEDNLKKICTIIKGENQPPINTSINREDFDSHLVEEYNKETSEDINGATIQILTPILQKGHGKKWSGIYSGKTISFEIEDKSFLEQVYNNEIKFGSATSIKCNLTIKKKEIFLEEDVNSLKEEIKYIVKEVLMWVDDFHLENETKKYKRIKSDVRELSLNFEDEHDE